jgi:hypothetical protein
VCAFGVNSIVSTTLKKERERRVNRRKK